MLRNKGILHVYGEQGTGRFLGAEMIGGRRTHRTPAGWAHQQQMTVDQMLDMPFYHPVIEEGLHRAARQAKLKLGTAEIERCQRCGRITRSFSVHTYRAFRPGLRSAFHIFLPPLASTALLRSFFILQH